MKRIKVIGIGSPFGPDQLGWQAVTHLQKILQEDAHEHDLSFMQSDRPGMQLLDLLKDCDSAILIDAINHKAELGNILQLEREQLVFQARPLSTHAMCVSECLTLGAALGMLPEQLVMFGVCIDSADPDDVPHAQVSALCERICAYVANDLSANPGPV